MQAVGDLLFGHRVEILDPPRRVRLRPEFLGLRSTDALHRFFGRDGFGQPVALGHHLFAGHLDEVLEEPA